MWADIEGPSWQRAQWMVRASQSIFGVERGPVSAVPLSGLGALRWPWFRPSPIAVVESTAHLVVDRWIEEDFLPADFDREQIVACVLPHGLAKLAAFGRMSFIGMSLCRRYPSQLHVLLPLARLRSQARVPDNPPAIVLTREAFSLLADALDEWLPAIVEAVEPDGVEESSKHNMNYGKHEYVLCMFRRAPSLVLSHCLYLQDTKTSR